MATKTHSALVCITMLVIGGCRSVNTQVSLSPTHYTVNVMILAVPQEAEPPMGSVSQSDVEALIKRRNTETIRFPTIHILPGETKDVETGETHSYAIGFDVEGKPTKYKTVRDGLSLRSTLSLLPDHQAKLAIAIEKSHIVRWNRSPAGNKTPVCKITSFGTTVRPKWGLWENVGKAMATETDKGKVILVRIDKPNKQPSAH
jgi:hypothetical protein